MAIRLCYGVILVWIVVIVVLMQMDELLKPAF